MFGARRKHGSEMPKRISDASIRRRAVIGCTSRPFDRPQSRHDRGRARQVRDQPLDFAADSAEKAAVGEGPLTRATVACPHFTMATRPRPPIGPLLHVRRAAATAVVSTQPRALARQTPGRSSCHWHARRYYSHRFCYTPQSERCHEATLPAE